MTPEEREYEFLRREQQREYDLQNEETDNYSQRKHEEWEIGAELITVSPDAKIAQTFEPVAVVNDDGVVTGWKMQKVKFGYKEPCNNDLASGFYDSLDQAILRRTVSLAIKIKELAESVKLPIRNKEGKIIGYKNLDLRPIYNRFVDMHNHDVVSSKGLKGQGAAMSRSHIAIEKSTKHLTRSENYGQENTGWQLPFKFKNQ